MKKVKQFHSSSAKKGSGDFYGSGVRNKMGRTVESMLVPAIPKKNIGKKPKSLA